MKPSNTKRELGGSPNLTQGKKLNLSFHPATSKSALGHFATTASPGGTTSLPEIAPNAQEALLKEMQREKERLQRYF